MYCGQTAVCITIQLGTEVGLILGDCVTWGHSSPPLKGHRPPILGPCVLWPKGWMDQHATWYGGIGLSQGDIVLDGDQVLPQKRAQLPIFDPHVLWPNGCVYHDTTWYGCRPQRRRQLCYMGHSSPPLKGHSPQFSAHVYCGQRAGWTKIRPRSRGSKR